jgi:hypothetical protein
VNNISLHHFYLELGTFEWTPSIQSIFEIGYYCEKDFFLAFQIAFDRGFGGHHLKADLHQTPFLQFHALSIQSPFKT